MRKVLGLTSSQRSNEQRAEDTIEGGLYPGKNPGDDLVSELYSLRFHLADHDKKVTVLQEFLVKYPHLFEARWVAEGAGRLLLGFDHSKNESAKKAAAGFLNSYWKFQLSPFRAKEIRALSALVWYDSPCTEHWAHVVRWMRRHPARHRVTAKLAAREYINSLEERCRCLPLRVVQWLCNGALDFPDLSPAEIVFKVVAKKWGMSSRTLSTYKKKFLAKKS